MASLSTDSNKNNQALVFGASGVTGWAIMNTAVTYPTPTTFSRIIGLTNRPLSISDAYLPGDKRLELYSGVDLSKNDSVVSKLKEIPNMDQITHVYFAAYTAHGSDYQELRRANVEILRNAVEALETLCPNMQFFTLQTGGKAYGIEFTAHVKIPVPTPETMPRIPEPWASNIFYYAQYDYLLSLSQTPAPRWKFCEIRPDVIVGFVPNLNAMNCAQALALFLLCWKHVHGSNAVVPFPGPPGSSFGDNGKGSAWLAKRTDTSQDILAKFHLWASLHPEKVEKRAFNVADGMPDVISWSDIWDGTCKFFNLKGGPPTGEVSGAQWMIQNKDKWGKWEEKIGIRKGNIEGTTWEFLEAVMGGKEGKSVDRQYDLSACREVGFQEKVDTVSGYITAFERMKGAGIIP